MTIQFSAVAHQIASQIQQNITALEGGGITCDRCGGQGVCSDPSWINTRTTDRHAVKHSGKVCFKCKGASTLGLKKNPNRKSVLSCGLAYYYSVTSTGVIDFGKMIHQYRKWENSVWGSVMKPLYHHINRAIIAQALQGKFIFQDDNLVWDKRCYSYYPYAQQFADLFSTRKSA
tara:strand:- start:183 stop:704 length:522 start_codon:yes stop_codon:yes gene_type:complete